MPFKNQRHVGHCTITVYDFYWYIKWNILNRNEGYKKPGNDETKAEVLLRKAANEASKPESGRHESWEYYDSC